MSPPPVECGVFFFYYMSETKPNGYQLSRQFFDFCFENPDKIRPIHSAIYFFAIEHCNRLGWKDKFGFPSQMAMDAIGVRNWRTYIVGFNDLVGWGFFDLVEKSKNQYSSNIIAIVKNTKAHTKALDKALQKHLQKHSQKQSRSTVSIYKQVNNEPLNNRTGKPREKFINPTLEEVKSYMVERELSHHNASEQSERFIDHYTSNGWKVGKNKMKDWKATVRNWVKNMEQYSSPKNGKTSIEDLTDNRNWGN